MPTNRELREVASALSKDLGVGASTDGLNNEKLTALVASLEATKAKLADATPSPPSSDESSDDTPPPAPAVQALRDGAERKSNEPKEEPPPPPAPARQDIVEPKASKWGYRIRQGFALHCLKGFLRNEAEVNPRDFTPQDFQRHLGVAIVKTKQLPPVEK